MTDLHSKIMRRAELNQSLAATEFYRQKKADDLIPDFMDGARWQSEQTRPLIEALAKAPDKLKESGEAHIFTANEIETIIELIYPNVFQCDCEQPCDCQYPPGWIALKNLKYHCYGSEIACDDALSSLAGIVGD